MQLSGAGVLNQAAGGGQRPAELSPRVAAAMRHLCLAEAQAVMAFKAYCKGSRPGTVAAVYAGVLPLLQRSHAALQQAAEDGGVPEQGTRMQVYMRSAAYSSLLPPPTLFSAQRANAYHARHTTAAHPSLA